jgi:predicted metal-dependent RNase
MKTIILRISVLVLLFALMGAGCGKEKDDYDPRSIVGKWGLIKENCGIDYNLVTEITPDSILRTYKNGNLISSSSFRIKKGKTDDTIFYENKKDYQTYAFIKLISGDTLRIYTNILYIAPVCEYSKRIKK